MTTSPLEQFQIATNIFKSFSPKISFWYFSLFSALVCLIYIVLVSSVSLRARHSRQFEQFSQDSFTHWFNHLEESFLLKKFSSKSFAHLQKTVALLLKMFYPMIDIVRNSIFSYSHSRGSVKSASIYQMINTESKRVINQ